MLWRIPHPHARIQVLILPVAGSVCSWLLQDSLLMSCPWLEGGVSPKVIPLLGQPTLMMRNKDQAPWLSFGPLLFPWAQLRPLLQLRPISTTLSAQHSFPPALQMLILRTLPNEPAAWKSCLWIYFLRNLTSDTLKASLSSCLKQGW